ncbi:phospholipase A1 [Marinospirillum celere]|uniref:Phospholipase A1 n=1 Tax=Marinospirillum celere TaxID=1122252 RepID=A0A1I1DWJ9_9GAMM|nr:phospholipase A [Marinospirillum celere]SFB78786.1 phospholipase A1 [Marinospirillum celere]
MTFRFLLALLLCWPLWVAAEESSESQGPDTEEAATADQAEDLRSRISEYQLLLRETLVEYSQLVRDYEFEYQETSLERRLNQERQLAANPFSFTPHRRNYILPASYSSNPNQERFEYIQENTDLDPVEIKFQLSVKVPLMEDLFDNRGSIHFAYTQTSWWQAYNNDASKPFRETNYTPEIFFTYANGTRFLGLNNNWNRFGYAHQSNGRTEPQSRSWNYLYVSSVLSRGNWMLEATPRIKLPRFRGEDDNPDLEDYIGYLDLSLAYTRSRHEYVLTLKGNPQTEKAGAQLDWSFPVYGRLRGLIQGYAGYGESLIDYDHENYRISIGFQFTNQLFGDY